MIFKRLLSADFMRFIEEKTEQNDVILLGGARQVGKTTMVKDVLQTKKAIYVNLYENSTLPEKIDRVESFDELEKLLLQEINFTPSQGTLLVVDEAQESKKFGRWIRFFKEKWPYQKVILLGSILSNLFEEGQPYPVGRVKEIVLRPFTFTEYLLATEREGLKEVWNSISLNEPLAENDREAFIKPYTDYLQTGGMPKVVTQFHEKKETPYDSWNQLLRQYALDVERYLKEPFKSLFLSAIDRLADLTCYPAKLSQVVSTDSPSYRRLPELLEVLEKWHLAFKVAAQTKSPESAGGLTSKRYLFDVGLMNFLLQQGQPVVWQNRPDISNTVYAKLQEAFVCQELIAKDSAPTLMPNYYRENRNSREIDFIVPSAGQRVPIEVKSQASVSRNALLPMVSFLEQTGQSHGVLVYNGPRKDIKIRGKIIHAIPPFLVRKVETLL